MYSVTAEEPTSPISRCLQGWFLLEVLKEHLIQPLSQLPVILGGPGPVDAAHPYLPSSSLHLPLCVSPTGLTSR